MKRKIWKLALAGLLLTPGTHVLASDIPLDIKTWAGQGNSGYKDGKAAIAEFNNPTAAIKAPDGTVYISDTSNNLIRAVSPLGTVTTFAGSISKVDVYGKPVGGYKDGSSSAAMFNQPVGLALGSNGILYVADSLNGAIRSIDSSGNVTTVIKDLNSPTSLAAAPNGDLFVSETLNHRILKISKGKAMVVAGGGLIGGFADGHAAEAKFNKPAGIALASDGTLYVADSGNQRIRRISTSGDVTSIAGIGLQVMPETGSIAGGFADGPASQAKFQFPFGISMGSDNSIYVADTYNHRIRKITADNRVETVAGSGEHGKQNGNETEAEFNGPTGVVEGANGRLLVVDQWNNSLRIIEPHPLPSSILSDSRLKVVLNDSLIRFPVEPVIVNNRTFVPLREIAEALGYRVSWDQALQTIVISSDIRKVKFQIGSRTVEGSVKADMDAVPFVKDGKTMVPIRDVAKLLGLDIFWLPENSTVYIRGKS